MCLPWSSLCRNERRLLASGVGVIPSLRHDCLTSLVSPKWQNTKLFVRWQRENTVRGQFLCFKVDYGQKRDHSLHF